MRYLEIFLYACIGFTIWDLVIFFMVDVVHQSVLQDAKNFGIGPIILREVLGGAAFMALLSLIPWAILRKRKKVLLK